MPIVKNNGTVTKFLGNVPVYPNEEKTVYHYPEVGDTDMEIISHKPTWPMGMTGPEKRNAIISSIIYQIPKDTNNLSIINISANNIVVYAQELIPGKVGTISGLFFGIAFGLAGIGAAILGYFIDIYGVVLIYKICSFLPLLGLFAIFLP